MKLLRYLFLLLSPCCLLAQNAQDGLPCSTCTEIQVQKIQQATQQFGLIVRTPHREQIDPNLAATRFLRLLAYKNWRPLSSQKQTLCGLVGHHNVHTSAKENDHNFRIIPDDDYSFLLEDAVQYRKTDKTGFLNWHDCNGGTNNCMESEITPADQFVEDGGGRFFQTAFDQKVCAYGPWVQEKLHNYRPEIHPAEVIWYHTVDKSRVLIFQDASRRYDQKRLFARLDKKVPKSGEKQPWVNDTLRVELGVYFEFETGQDSLSIQWTIEGLSKHLKTQFKSFSQEIQLVLKEEEFFVAGTLDGQGIALTNVLFCEKNGVKQGLVYLDVVIFREGKELGFLVMDVKKMGE